jgi:hypothetical protein
MFKNSSFVEEIESLCKDNLEIETAAYWIKKDPVMKSKIQLEAENLNVLKRGARLPI